MDIAENFTFNASCADGAFSFSFKWLNDRWNVWVTLPDGTIRQAGVEPNVTSWSGFSDYGLFFKTDLSVIDYNSLFLCDLILVAWE